MTNGKYYLIWVGVLIVLFFLLGIIDSHAAMITPLDTEHQWSDINKRDDMGEQNLCWAAAISNAVFTTLRIDPKATFLELKELYGDIPYYPSKAYRNLLISHDWTEQAIGQYLDIFNTTLSKVWLMNWVQGALLQKEVVILAIQNIDPEVVGHAMTVYGYEMVNNERWLIFADSNDGKHQLLKSRFYLNKKGRWMFNEQDSPYYKHWYMENALSAKLVVQ